jgi:hypothetical protein
MTARTSRTAKTAAAKPAVMLADPDATPTETPIETPIVATSIVLSNGINAEDVNQCKTLANDLKAHRKADKEICRDLGIVWNKMAAAWKGEGACAKWIGTQFGFAERTVYLYRKLADNWDLAASLWPKKCPNLPVELATINEFMGLLAQTWSPEEPKPKTKPTPTEAKDKATTAPNGAATVRTTAPTVDPKNHNLPSLELVHEGLEGLVMISNGLQKITDGTQVITDAKAKIREQFKIIEEELMRIQNVHQPLTW